MDTIKVDPEFSALIPPLHPDEKAQLESNILADGCLSPLVVWGDLLVDGHNRYEICKRLGIPFDTIQKGFESRVDARIWIRNNQIGRRNLSEAWRIDLALGNKEDLLLVGRERMLAGARKSSAAEIGSDINVRPSHSTRKQIADAADVSQGQIGKAETVRRESPSLWQQAKDQAITIGRAFNMVTREKKLADLAETLNDISTREVKEAQGVFDVIVMDPPWPVEMDPKDGRATPIELTYPTMGLKEIANLKIPAADDCHVWIWTTQRFLPAAIQMLAGWGLSYVCTFVWNKPGGMQIPGRPQYNTEFAIYAQRGHPEFVDTKSFFTSFNAPRGDQSAKPDEFYDMVRRVTAGRRLDMFNRREIAGFERWGNEAM